MKALQILQQLAHRKKVDLHPLIPLHALPKFTDQNTNGLTTAVIECFRLHGFFATRIDSKGTYNQALKRFIPSNQKKGLPDVFAQAPGLPPIWVMVKCEATKDRLKPHQVEVIEQLRRSGALVFVATDFEDFYQWFKQTIIKTEVNDMTHEIN